MDEEEDEKAKPSTVRAKKEIKKPVYQAPSRPLSKRVFTSTRKPATMQQEEDDDDEEGFDEELSEGDDEDDDEYYE